MKKRLLNVLLIAVILLTLLPMTAFAEGEGGGQTGGEAAPDAGEHGTSDILIL